MALDIPGNLEIKSMKFRFNKDELGNKRPNVELSVPVPKLEKLAEVIEHAYTKNDEGKEVLTKEAELLLEAVQDIIQLEVRGYVQDNLDVSPENFPYDKFTWEAIANQDKVSRRGAGIPKETWEAFSKDYIATMPALTGKTAEQVGNAAKIFVRKFKDVAGNTPIIKKLQEQLSIYISNSKQAEEYTDVLEFLTKKAEDMTKTVDYTKNL